MPPPSTVPVYIRLCPATTHPTGPTYPPEHPPLSRSIPLAIHAAHDQSSTPCITSSPPNHPSTHPLPRHPCIHIPQYQHPFVQPTTSNSTTAHPQPLIMQVRPRTRRRKDQHPPIAHLGPRASIIMRQVGHAHTLTYCLPAHCLGAISLVRCPSPNTTSCLPPTSGVVLHYLVWPLLDLDKDIPLVQVGRDTNLCAMRYYRPFYQTDAGGNGSRTHAIYNYTSAQRTAQRNTVLS